MTRGSGRIVMKQRVSPTRAGTRNERTSEGADVELGMVPPEIAPSIQARVGSRYSAQCATEQPAAQRQEETLQQQAAAPLHPLLTQARLNFSFARPAQEIQKEAIVDNGLVRCN